MKKKTFFLFIVIFLCNNYQVLHAQNVGIGTTTPADKLTVETANNSYGITHRSTTGNILSTRIGGTTAGIGTFSPTDMRIFSGGISRMIISQATGEVFIGTDDISNGNKLFVRTAPGNPGITHSDGNITLSTFTGGTQPFAYIGTQSNHALSFYTNNSPSQAILLPNGNFGIGNISPAYKLDVTGSVRTTGNIRSESNGEFFGSVGIGTSATAGTGLFVAKSSEAIRIDGNQSFISFYNGPAYKGYLWNKGADDMELGTGGTNTNGKLFLSIKGTPYLTLQSNGQVSVAGDPAPYLSPAFSVRGNGILGLTGVSVEWTIKPLNYNGSDAPGPRLFLYGNGFLRAYLDADGDWNSVSDRSFKENIQQYKPVLEGLKKLQVSTYYLKHNSPGKKSFGFIAQNVAEYFPEIVSSFQDKDGTKKMGIAYTKIGVLAIKAIQEQQVIIETQQKKIEELEKRLESLEKRFND